ncbi:hypothetical protein CR513_61841, partial [Mucuna pruriens]
MRKEDDNSPYCTYAEEHKKALMNLLKCHIPPFNGAGDVETYFDWEIKFYREICEGRRKHANTWVELKKKMRIRFILVSYARDLYNKLQRIYQGSKSIEEYHKDMEVALSRANVLESSKAIMDSFLHRLNQDIEDMVEFLASRRTYPSISNNWRGKGREKERSRREKSPKKGSILPPCRKEEGKLPNPVSASKSSNIKCFKCLGKGHIAYEYSRDKDGDLLVVRRKICSVIIDSGSSVNIASTRLVEKLKLPTLAHPKPYKLQWLNSKGEIAVAKQVSSTFTVGQYKDEVILKPLSPKELNENQAKMKLRREKQKEREKIEKKE